MKPSWQSLDPASRWLVLLSAAGLVLLIALAGYRWQTTLIQPAAKRDDLTQVLEKPSAPNPALQAMMARQTGARLQTADARSKMPYPEHYYQQYSPEITAKLRKLGGILLQPVNYFSLDRTNVSPEEILAMCPYLKREDGSVDRDTADKLRILLFEAREKTRREHQIEETNRALIVEMRFQEAIEAENGKLTPKQQISALVRSLETRPERILPKEELASISPKFAAFSVDEMRELLIRLADAQQVIERGNVNPLAQQTIQRWATNMQRWASNPRRNIVLTDAHLEKLLTTPMEDLVVPVYANKPQ